MCIATAFSTLQGLTQVTSFAAADERGDEQSRDPSSPPENGSALLCIIFGQTNHTIIIGDLGTNDKTCSPRGCVTSNGRS